MNERKEKQGRIIGYQGEKKEDLAHAVLVLLLDRHLLAIELVVNNDIQIPRVAGVG